MLARQKIAIKKLIVESLDSLSEERLYEVLDFVEFLKHSASGYGSDESEEDPLIGLFAGARELSRRSEEILQEEVRERSGLTWKG